MSEKSESASQAQSETLEQAITGMFEKEDSQTQDGEEQDADEDFDESGSDSDDPEDSSGDPEESEDSEGIDPEDEGEQEESEDEDDEDSEEEDLKDQPFHKHPRFKKIVQQKNEFKQKAEMLEKELGKFNPVAEILDQNGLNVDDTIAAVELLNKVRTRPNEAIQILDGLKNRIQKDNNLEIPKYIQDAIDDGSIDSEVAEKLISDYKRMQGQAVDAKHVVASTAKKTEASNAEAIKEGVSSWLNQEVQQRPELSDPKKAQILVRFIQSDILENGRPKTPQEAVNRARRCLEDVVAIEATKRKPTRKKKTVTRSDSISSKRVSKEPSSLEEAIARAVQK